MAIWRTTELIGNYMVKKMGGMRDRTGKVCLCARVRACVRVCGGNQTQADYPHAALLSTFLLAGLGAPVAHGASLLLAQ